MSRSSSSTASRQAQEPQRPKDPTVPANLARDQIPGRNDELPVPHSRNQRALEMMISERGIRFESWDDLYRFSQIAVATKLTPQGVNTWQQAFLLVQRGMEIGLSPTQALTDLYVVNGRVSLMGEGALAAIRASGKLKSYRDGETGTPFQDDYTVWIEMQRTDMPDPVRTSYSVAEAKVAGLWGKAGPWKSHPKDMLYWRALGRQSKRQWSDIIRGMDLAEIARDIPREIDAGSSRLHREPPAGRDPVLEAIGAGGPEGEPEPEASETVDVNPTPSSSEPAPAAAASEPAPEPEPEPPSPDRCVRCGATGQLTKLTHRNSVLTACEPCVTTRCWYQPDDGGPFCALERDHAGDHEPESVEQTRLI